MDRRSLISTILAAILGAQVFRKLFPAKQQSNNCAEQEEEFIKTGLLWRRVPTESVNPKPVSRTMLNLARQFENLDGGWEGE